MGLLCKFNFDQVYFSSKWTKDVDSNSSKLGQSCNLPRDHKFTLEMDQKCTFLDKNLRHPVDVQSVFLGTSLWSIIYDGFKPSSSWFFKS